MSSLSHKVDLPVWDFLQPSPITFLGPSATCVSMDSGETARYIYHLGSVFYRYDTWTDSWQQLSNLPFSKNYARLVYTTDYGHFGNVLSSTHNTLTIGGLNGKCFIGKKIKIINGTGLGQEKTIIGMTENNILDSGIVDSSNAESITDSAKRWKKNQWVGYSLRVVAIGGYTQYRTIMYNGYSNLGVEERIANSKLVATDYWTNNSFWSIPVATSGSQSRFFIESVDVTLDSDWDIVPDETSKFQIMTGGIWCLTGNVSGQPFTLYYYNVISDTWFRKCSIPSTFINESGSTNDAMGLEGFKNVSFDSGIVSSANNLSFTDITKNFEFDRYANYQIYIYEGLGCGQRRRIVGNSNSSIYVTPAFNVVPDNTSKYKITCMTDKLFFIHGENSILQFGSVLFQYDISNDMWVLGNCCDSGIMNECNMVDVKNNVYILNGGGGGGVKKVSMINEIPIDGGNGYTVGDLLVSSYGMEVYVEAVDINGSVLHLSLYNTSAALGLGNISLSGGSGVGCIVEVTEQVANNIHINIENKFNLKFGDIVYVNNFFRDYPSFMSKVLFDGGGLFIVIDYHEVYSPYDFKYGRGYDITKNWIPNEHAGKLVSYYEPANNTIMTTGRIISNTNNRLIIPFFPSASTGSRYVIHDPDIFGCAKQYKNKNNDGVGWATGGTLGTLIDSTKSWKTDCWSGYNMLIVCGTGLGVGILSITGNDSTTLILSSPGFVPDATTKYKIMDTYGVITSKTGVSLTDITKKWDNDMWVGHRVRVMSGGSSPEEFIVSSNTSNTLFSSSVNVDIDAPYAIMGIQPRKRGCFLKWNYGCTDLEQKGKYIYSARGGGTFNIDRYDITRNYWKVNYAYDPMSEFLNVGTMTAYDGVDRIYSTISGTNKIISFNIVTSSMSGGLSFPVAHGAVTVGQYMEISRDEDDLPYLFLWQHSGAFGYRTLLMSMA